MKNQMEIGNLTYKGLAAGNVIELTVALKNNYDDPKAALITVWFD